MATDYSLPSDLAKALAWSKALVNLIKDLRVPVAPFDTIELWVTAFEAFWPVHAGAAADVNPLLPEIAHATNDTITLAGQTRITAHQLALSLGMWMASDLQVAQRSTYFLDLVAAWMPPNAGAELAGVTKARVLRKMIGDVSSRFDREDLGYLLARLERESVDPAKRRSAIERESRVAILPGGKAIEVPTDAPPKPDGLYEPSQVVLGGKSFEFPPMPFELLGTVTAACRSFRLCATAVRPLTVAYRPRKMADLPGSHFRLGVLKTSSCKNGSAVTRPAGLESLAGPSAEIWK